MGVEKSHGIDKPSEALRKDFDILWLFCSCASVLINHEDLTRAQDPVQTSAPTQASGRRCAQ